MMKKIILTITALSLLFFAGCGKKSPVLAKVDNWALTIEEFNNEIEKLPEEYREIAKQHKEEFLDEVISRYLLYKEACRRQFDRDREIKDFINTTLQKIVVRKFLDSAVFKKIDVSDDKIMQYYQVHKPDFAEPQKIKVRHILVRDEPAAAAIYKQLTSGADFTTLARQNSICPSRERGGELGLLKQGDLIPEFEQVAFSLNVGEVSKPVKTKLGFHIIQLTERVAARYKPFEEVKDDIRSQLLGKGYRQEIDSLLARLKTKSKIKINKLLLTTDENK